MNSIQRITKFKSIITTISSNSNLKNLNTNKFINNNSNKCNNNNNGIKNILSSLSSSSRISTPLMINNNDRYYKLNYTTSNNKALQQQQEQNEKQYHLLINDSIEKFKSGELIAAVEILDDAISLCTNLPNAYLLRADIKSFCKKTFKISKEQIIKDYETAIELVADNQKPYIYYSIVNYFGYSLYPSYTESLKYVNKGLEYITNNEMKMLFLFEKIVLKCNSNDLEGIMEPAKELLGINKHLGTIGLAFILITQNNYTASMELIQSIIDVEKDKPVVNKYDGHTVYNNHLIIVQEDAFTRIRDKSYDSPGILFNCYIGFAMVHTLEQNLQAAYDAYKCALDIAPYAFVFRSFMSTLMLNLHNYDQAIEEVNKFLEYDPNDESDHAKIAHRDRGLALYAQENYSKAYDDLQTFGQMHAIHFYNETVVADRSDALTALLYILCNQLNYHSGLDQNKFNLREITKQIDFTNTLSGLTTENSPKHIQQLLIYSKILFTVYYNLGKSIKSHLVKCSAEEKSEIHDREALFYFMSLYLNDSLYLNHVNNHSDIEYPAEIKSEQDMVVFSEFLMQLPYRESKQSPNRQDAHKNFLEAFNKIIKLDQNK